jgi:DnaJ-domain-containing protein 1
MSISKRLIDLARANLNALLEKSGGSTNVDELTDDELEAELERRRDRRRREESERRDREAAERAARERAAQRPSPSARPPRPSSSARPRTPPPASPPSPSKERRLRELYAQLEVPYGAPFDDVKKSFRRLMRKYHPDLHVGNPTKHKTATQLTMSLTQAYNEIEQILVGGPNRG